MITIQILIDLSVVDSMIVNDTSLVTISYHNTLIDAETNTAPIGNTYNYTHQVIILFSFELYDINTGCPIVIPFDLQINQNPIANTPPDLIDCDDDYDGFLEFDLSANANAIMGTQLLSDHEVTYYSEQLLAEQKTNPLNNLHTTFDGEVIFARIENINTGCFGITQFSTFINPLPVVPY